MRARAAKCLLRAACHSCGPYCVPNVDVESIAVYTNNPTSGAMRGFGTNQAHFAMEGIMGMLAERSASTAGKSARATSSIRAIGSRPAR